MAKKEIATDARISSEEMKASIERSGYLIEQRVEPILTSAGFYVQANPVYPDPATGKSREIDISALSARSLNYKNRDYDFIFPMILCECENNAQPLVFFTRESPISFWHHQELKVSGIPVKIWDRDRDSYLGMSEFAKMEKYHHYCSGEVATQYCTFKLKKDKSAWIAFHSDEQHDTLNSIINILEYEIAKHYDNWSLPEKDEIEKVNIQIYYPLIIVQGDLYAASLQNNRLNIRKNNHIQFRRGLFLPYTNEVETYQIDIINERYLSDYLKIIDSEMSRIKKMFQRNKDKVLLSIDKIVEEARISKEKEKTDSYRKSLEF